MLVFIKSKQFVIYELNYDIDIFEVHYCKISISIDHYQKSRKTVQNKMINMFTIKHVLGENMIRPIKIIIGILRVPYDFMYIYLITVRNHGFSFIKKKILCLSSLSS